MFQKHMDNLEKRMAGVEKVLHEFADRVRELEAKLALPEDYCCRNGHDLVPYGTTTDTLLHLQLVLYCRRCGIKRYA